MIIKVDNGRMKLQKRERLIFHRMRSMSVEEKAFSWIKKTQIWALTSRKKGREAVCCSKAQEYIGIWTHSLLWGKKNMGWKIWLALAVEGLECQTNEVGKVSRWRVVDREPVGHSHNLGRLRQVMMVILLPLWS
jgi:hypothetical protein